MTTEKNKQYVRYYQVKFYALAMFALAGMILLSACAGKQTVGAPVPADVAPVPLAAILEDPAAYEGQTVVLRGNLTGQCASLCDFSYTENGQTVTVFMGALKPPRIPTGQPVRVLVNMHSGEKQLVFSALGLEVLPRGAQP